MYRLTPSKGHQLHLHWDRACVFVSFTAESPALKTGPWTLQILNKYLETEKEEEEERKKEWEGKSSYNITLSFVLANKPWR